jgi:hypothetical protein
LLFQEVCRRITADRKLRKNSESRSLGSRAPAEDNDLFEVAGEVPNRRIDLRESDFHTTSLN